MILTVATTVFSNQISYIFQGLIWVPHLLTQPCLTTPACVTASLRLHPGHALTETNYRFLLHLIYLSPHLYSDFPYPPPVSSLVSTP